MTIRGKMDFLRTVAGKINHLYREEIDLYSTLVRNLISGRLFVSKSAI